MMVNEQKPLDLLSATSIVAASMIGAGVFTTSGYALGSLESPWLVVAAWAVAGIIAICGAICYGALASRFTESGGEYLFLSRTIHPVAGIMAGWVSLLAGFTGAMAFAATTFEKYVSPLHSLDVSPNVIASSLVVAAALLHSFSVKPGARVQDTIVILKFVLIGAFAVFACYALLGDRVPEPDAIVPPVDPAPASDTAVEATPEPPWIGIRFATQLVWISLSYSGFQAAIYIAGEVRNPEKNVRRAILLGTTLVTIVYLILNAIFVFAAPASKIVFQEQVATISAQAIGGESFALFTRIVILLCLVTSVSALTITGPRVYSKMADDGLMPALLGFRTGGSPIISIWLQAVLAIVVIWVSTLTGLLGYLGFTLSVSAALTAGLLFFIKREPGTIPLYPLPVVIFVYGTMQTAVLAAFDKPIEAVVALATILFGALLYPIYRMFHARTS